MNARPTIAEIAAGVEARRQPYIEIADRIWGYAELRYREFESAELHAATLEAEGFRVTRGVAGMPTAFVAEAGSGGPVIGFLGEYDALAGFSQEAGAPERRPDPDGGNQGHGCGHHLLGTAAHLAAVRRQGLSATPSASRHGALLRLPGRGSRRRQDLHGARRSLRRPRRRAAWHPSVANVGIHEATLANVQAHFRFRGKAAHAAWRRTWAAARSTRPS